MANENEKNIIEVKGLKNYLGNRWIHKDINLSIRKNEIVAIIGTSGCGKTTLLRSLLMLHQPSGGDIKVFNTDILHCTEEEAFAIRKRWGVMFQSSALFSSLTVLENVLFPLKEYSEMSPKQQEEVAFLKISLAGLELSDAYKYPGELSGGMKKRAALARAIALDPEILFLDEPTTGLDPNSADVLDNLILKMHQNLGLTFVIVTHDLDTLWRVSDRVAFLGEGKVLAIGKIEDLIQDNHPLIKDYFSGPRGQFKRKRQ